MEQDDRPETRVVDGKVYIVNTHPTVEPKVRVGVGRKPLRTTGGARRNAAAHYEILDQHFQQNREENIHNNPPEMGEDIEQANPAETTESSTEPQK